MAYIFGVWMCAIFPFFHPSNLCSRFVRWKNAGKSRCLNNEKFPWWPTNFADACFSAYCNEKCVLLFLVYYFGQKKSKLFWPFVLVIFWSWTLQKVHFFEGLRKVWLVTCRLLSCITMANLQIFCTTDYQHIMQKMANSCIIGYNMVITFRGEKPTHKITTFGTINGGQPRWRRAQRGSWAATRWHQGACKRPQCLLSVS